jgi:hypothetical protein
MAQQEWDILIHLGDEVPRYVGAMKAWDEQEAKEKGTRLANGRGLIGLIEILSSGPASNTDVNYHVW